MDQLTEILAKQAGFNIDEHKNISLGDAWCTLEVKLLAQLVAAWCLEKNRRYLFAHQASQEIARDFALEPNTNSPQRPQ
jgi:hypothetical protein